MYLGILQSHALRARGIPLQADAMNLAALESVLGEKAQGQIHRLKLLYLVSYCQNPTGTTTATAKKIAILELLRRYEVAAGHGAATSAQIRKGIARLAAALPDNETGLAKGSARRPGK